MTDESFTAKTLQTRSKGHDVSFKEPDSRIHTHRLQPLRTTEEVAANVIWRFLQMREYLGKEHNLTPWGVFLEATLKALGSSPAKVQVEAAFVGVELLRLGLLNPSTMFPNYPGAPLRKTGRKPLSCQPNCAGLTFDRNRSTK